MLPAIPFSRMLLYLPALIASMLMFCESVCITGSAMLLCPPQYLWWVGWFLISIECIYLPRTPDYIIKIPISSYTHTLANVPHVAKGGVRNVCSEVCAHGHRDLVAATCRSGFQHSFPFSTTFNCRDSVIVAAAGDVHHHRISAGARGVRKAPVDGSNRWTLLQDHVVAKALGKSKHRRRWRRRAKWM